MNKTTTPCGNCVYYYNGTCGFPGICDGVVRINKSTFKTEWTNDNALNNGSNSILNGLKIGDWPPGPQIGDTPSASCGWVQYGWVCPKCGRVLSPTTTSCPCSEPVPPNVSSSVDKVKTAP